MALSKCRGFHLVGVTCIDNSAPHGTARLSLNDFAEQKERRRALSIVVVQRFALATFLFILALFL